jgi:hypothetical protein
MRDSGNHDLEVVGGAERCIHEMLNYENGIVFDAGQHNKEPTDEGN